MLRKTITVTEQQNSWIKSQIESGQYGNDSEYMRDLVRKDQEYNQKLSALQVALKEGEDSGESTLSMNDILIKVKKNLNIDG
ncbi:addiction module antitoxin [Candidatus Thioglobus autotrophicus]|jgi:antitoxin ParD1/3/4|uniref:Antitoxin ParD n=1 Tax=Candidatus Thioglobus autotrophicus TaxID=1705394 RepID=A0A0M4NHR9_9GAMM|nr:type II toxin-antitoxin system ParD family antitoxin [Candidatus Thioglobus autotrophicus]ALE51900.1 addiction module antitoxin [Candidatus Thioglobus autotrophicus]MBT5164567.1 type II toxin-antitoxin system ParD family antitoxin [Candidatus Thioglobus sp.]WPE15973.1 type II toxin-antitoxin system ParD family antitoxin [Candidatus Thioglobus autotrophicus]